VPYVAVMASNQPVSTLGYSLSFYAAVAKRSSRQAFLTKPLIFDRRWVHTAV